MERKGLSYLSGKALWLLLFFCTVFLSAGAGNPVVVKLRFKQLFLNGDMSRWKMVVDSLRKEKLTDAEDDLLLYGEYGLIGYLIGNDQKDVAKPELALFESHIASRMKKQPGEATLHAFKAASVGFAIGLQPWKAISLGSESQSEVEKAMSHRVNEPLPLCEWANSLYYRPSFAGGDKVKAIRLYEQALSIYREEDADHWMYLSVSALLGQIYARRGDKEAARRLYIRVLKENPDFGWVRNELLPALDSKKTRTPFYESFL